MVSGHRDVLGVMKTEAQSGADPELKAFAGKATSTVQAHLTHALDVQRAAREDGDGLSLASRLSTRCRLCQTHRLEGGPLQSLRPRS